MEMILTPKIEAGAKANLMTSQNLSPDAKRLFDEYIRADNAGEDADLSKFTDLVDADRASALCAFVLERLDDEKAEDIIAIDLEGKSEIAEAMIIASGRSGRHVSGVSEKIQRSLKSIGYKDLRIQGRPACDWVLVDAGDIIIHLFRPEVREFYNLERIWSEAARAPAVESQ